MIATLFLSLAIAIGLVGAPLFWWASIRYRRRYQQVVLTWKATRLVFYTLLAFITNLTLFTLACLFFATYLGRMNGWDVLKVGGDTLLVLGSSCMLLIVGVSVSYLAFQNFLTQFVTEDGIFFIPDLGSQRPYLLSWDKVRDYFILSDYPVSLYQFLFEKADGTFGRHELKVPFYMTHRFEVLVDQKMKRAKERRHRTLTNTRKLPGS
jgi:hypothetical protein